MDYQTAVQTEFIPRCTAGLNQIASALISVGLPAAGVVVSMPDTTDLRFQIVAKKGNKTLTAYIELTDGTHLGLEPGKALFTFWVDGNGTEITSGYVPGSIQSYMDEAGVALLLAKLSDLETFIPAATMKIRAFLGL